MRNTLTLTVKLPLKDLNRLIALAGENIITDEETLTEYDYKTLDISEFPDSELEFKVGVSALFLAARERNDEKKNKSSESY